MSKTVIAFGLLIIAGCKTPSSPAPVSRYDLAIENLSITTEQLETVQKEKRFFCKSARRFRTAKRRIQGFPE